jgi:hypothetical protein
MTVLASFASARPLDRPVAPRAAAHEERAEEALGLSHCAHCLAPAPAEVSRCPGCDASFQGAGYFDRITGPPPSREFAFLFSRTAAPARHHDHVAKRSS